MEFSFVEVSVCLFHCLGLTFETFTGHFFLIWERNVFSIWGQTEQSLSTSSHCQRLVKADGFQVIVVGCGGALSKSSVLLSDDNLVKN